jgi:hypothetical protein
MGWAQEGLGWAWDGHGLCMGMGCLHPRVATACLLHITVAWWAHGVRHGLRMRCAWAVHGHRLPPPTSGYRLLLTLQQPGGCMGLGMGCGMGWLYMGCPYPRVAAACSSHYSSPVGAAQQQRGGDKSQQLRGC